MIPLPIVSQGFLGGTTLSVASQGFLGNLTSDARARRFYGGRSRNRPRDVQESIEVVDIYDEEHALSLLLLLCF